MMDVRIRTQGWLELMTPYVKFEPGKAIIPIHRADGSVITITLLEKDLRWLLQRLEAKKDDESIERFLGDGQAQP